MINRIDFRQLVCEALYKRGSLFGEMKQYDKAEKDFSACIGLDAGETKAISNRGYYRMMNGQYEPAIRDFNILIGKDSTDALAYNNRGLAEYYLKHYDLAEADCLRSQAYKPDNSYVWLNLGRICLATGRKKEACEKLEKAVQLGNKEAESLRKEACEISTR
ncbi:MAG: tetratricopeptide repeat protein [Bacteroidota bacterium]|nr:tetratricopeptide repeat protein [Bacteroidota bacterium]